MKRRWLVRAAVALVLLGAVAYEGYEVVESPGSQLFGKTLVSGPKNQRVVALTYDDGPNPPYTGELLSVLRAEGVHATFFVVGRAVAAYPDVVRREVLDGNAVGNHTWSHEHLCSTTRAAFAAPSNAPIGQSSRPPGFTLESCGRPLGAAIGWCSVKCASWGTRP
ncbi:MAG: polysaccharide deacetylase family protein [Candidatus Cybelea sp.]